MMMRMKKVIILAEEVMTIQFRKVKSHQTGQQDELPFEAKLNNRADELAVWIKTRFYGPVHSLQIQNDTGLAIFNDEGIKVKDINAFIYGKVKGDATEEYLLKKKQLVSRDSEAT